MRHFPLFLNLNGEKVTVSGSGEAAASKLRLLLKTNAVIQVFGDNPAPPVIRWAETGQIDLIKRPLREGDINESRLLYCANECSTEDRRAAKIGKAEGALVCIVDNLEDSEFITPAMVDRDPVTVAIGTEGTAPVLARKIKKDLESQLPQQLGMLASEARKFRPVVAALPEGRVRRKFWSRFFEKDGISAVNEGQDRVLDRLNKIFDEIQSVEPEDGRVVIGGYGDGNPFNLTLHVRQLLDEADVIIHDSKINPHILELARREAEFVPRPRSNISCAHIISDRVSKGHLVGVLVSDTSSNDMFIKNIISFLNMEGADWEIRPGITTELSINECYSAVSHSNSLQYEAV